MGKKQDWCVDVEPAILEWAVSTSGYTKEEVARKKLNITLESFEKWFTKDLTPTFRQLEELAKAVKRPVAVFFLPAPPQEKPLPKDYRLLAEKKDHLERKTLLAIRMARKLQRLGKELSENLNAKLETGVVRAAIADDPEQIAEKVRLDFSFTEDLFEKLKKPKELFDLLRDSIEEKNILVFQTSMPLDDARGFSLVDDDPAVIVVNSKDQLEARSFTLAHELGHVILNESGIDLPENSLCAVSTPAIEKWCNDFAAAVLLPESIAKKEFEAFKNTLIQTSTLNGLARKHKLSKHMLLYNMRKLGFISKTQYDSVLDRYKPAETKEKGQKKKGGFGQASDRKCINEKGQKFVSLVAHNVEKGLITRSEALDYLSIKSKSLDKVVGRAKK